MTANDSIQRIITAAAEARPSELFDRAVGTHQGLVIAGAAGMVAEHTLAGLRRLGIRPVALADNNVALWGTTVDGVTVLSPSDAVSHHPDAAFVAAIFTHTPLRRQLAALGAGRAVSYAPLFHKHAEAFLPYFAVDHPRMMVDEADAVRRAACIWADQESADLYSAILNWFVTLDSDTVPAPAPPKETYFPAFLRLRPDEVFVDCGAFDGDTVLAYVDACAGRYGTIIAVEPDPRTFLRLSARVARLERTIAMNAAVGARQATMPFVATGALSSHVVSAGAQGLAPRGPIMDVEVVPLDELSPRPTYVKMDIEGFEREALAGGLELLSRGDTAFAVTLYHRMSDLWRLPLYMHEFAPDLQFVLRHYAEDWAETICYAVPRNRLSTRAVT